MKTEQTKHIFHLKCKKTLKKFVRSKKIATFAKNWFLIISYINPNNTYLL